MGASLTMIDRHYGHLARDGREHAIRLLDSYADTTLPTSKLVDVRWTPQLPIVAGTDNGNSAEQEETESPLTDSNRRPPPYHGGALPTELRGRSVGV